MALLESRRALIIGSASGIGQETARLFAREGARVVLGDIDDKAGQETAIELSDAGHQASYIHVDITDKSAVEAAVSATVNRLGGLDVLVVTPFVNTAFDIMSLTAEDWHREIDVLATGTLFAFQAAIPVMRTQGGGVLLTTSSAHFGDYGAMTHPSVIPAYGSGKAAVELLVRTTARLHAVDGIRVNAVQPGFTVTRGVLERFLPSAGIDLSAISGAMAPGMPMGPGQPEEVAEGFLFLASDYASYITGYSLPVDGGSLTGAFGKLLV